MSARLLEARPSLGTDYRSRSRARTIGLALGFVGVALATVTLINAIAAGILAGRTGEETTVARLLAWSFGLTVTAFGTLKLGIAVILVGILVRLWLRVDSVKESLPFLKPAGSADAVPEIGKVQTPYGKATASASAPKPLLIHRMAKAMWAPMLAMGVMALLSGFVLSLVQTNTIGTDPALATSQAAWVQGLQFLGEGFLLAGISFLLGTILGSLRKGGGEVQESVGVGVKTLDMPLTAKLFVGLMALGLMVEVFQFIAYAVVATFDDPARIATYFTWLGPVREAGLGILLSGIVLALATIAKALGFQSWRLTEIVRTGTLTGGIEMASTLHPTPFRYTVSTKALGLNLPQRLGTTLWLPMLIMALMAFPVGVVLAGIRANEVANGGSPDTVAALGHFVTAANFVGFASVFAAISFAIARILGVFRAGGGEIQEAAGRKVETLRMPWTAKASIGLMAMAMMILVGAVVLHVVVGSVIAGGSADALGQSERWSIWLEGARRFGIATYLLAIAFGLSTIITALRFQAVRIRELPDEAKVGG